MIFRWFLVNYKLISAQFTLSVRSLSEDLLQWSSGWFLVNYRLTTQLIVIFSSGSDDLMNFWLISGHYKLISAQLLLSVYSLSNDLKMIFSVISGQLQLSFRSIATQGQLTLWWSSDDLLSDFWSITNWFQLYFHSVSVDSQTNL